MNDKAFRKVAFDRQHNPPTREYDPEDPLSRKHLWNHAKKALKVERKQKDLEHRRIHKTARTRPERDPDTQDDAQVQAQASLGRSRQAKWRF